MKSIVDVGNEGDPDLPVHSDAATPRVAWAVRGPPDTNRCMNAPESVQKFIPCLITNV